MKVCPSRSAVAGTWLAVLTVVCVASWTSAVLAQQVAFALGDAQVIEPPTTVDDVFFGRAVCADRTVAVVGGVNEAHVYNLVGHEWVRGAELIPTGAASVDFGFSCAVDATSGRIVVSDPELAVGGQAKVGAVYVFEGAPSWPLVATIINPLGSGGKNTLFGYGLDTDAGRIVAGAPKAKMNNNKKSGVAYVFEESGGAWGLTQTLNAPTKDYELGTAVAVCGDRVYGGAPGAKIGNQGGHGAILAWHVSAGGVYTEEVLDTAGNNLDRNDYLGYSIDCDEFGVVVGEPGEGTDDQGGVWIYSYDSALGAHESNPLLLTDGGTEKVQFGAAVSVSASLIAVGATDGELDGTTTGLVHFFGLSPAGVWVRESIPVPVSAGGPPVPIGNRDELGFAVAVTTGDLPNSKAGAGWVLAGAPEAENDTLGTSKSGRVLWWERATVGCSSVAGDAGPQSSGVVPVMTIPPVLVQDGEALFFAMALDDQPGVDGSSAAFVLGGSYPLNTAAGSSSACDPIESASVFNFTIDWDTVVAHAAVELNLDPAADPHGSFPPGGVVGAFDRYTTTVEVTWEERFGAPQTGLPMVRTMSQAFFVVIDVPTTVVVEEADFFVFDSPSAAVYVTLAHAAITVESIGGVNGAPDDTAAAVMTVTFSTVLQHPFRLSSVTVASVPANAAAASLVETSDPSECDGALPNTLCVQRWTATYTNIDTSACTLAGLYEFSYEVDCSTDVMIGGGGGGGGENADSCPLPVTPLASTSNMVVGLAGNDPCLAFATVDIQAVPVLETRDAPSCAIDRDSFVDTEDVCFWVGVTADLPIASTLITLVSADGVSLASNDASPGSEDTLIAPISTWADAEYASWYSKTFVATIEVTYVDGARRRSVVASARGSGRGRSLAASKTVAMLPSKSPEVVGFLSGDGAQATANDGNTVLSLSMTAVVAVVVVGGLLAAAVVAVGVVVVMRLQRDVAAASAANNGGAKETTEGSGGKMGTGKAVGVAPLPGLGVEPRRAVRAAAPSSSASAESESSSLPLSSSTADMVGDWSYSDDDGNGGAGGAGAGDGGSGVPGVPVAAEGSGGGWAASSTLEESSLSMAGDPTALPLPPAFAAEPPARN